MNNKLVAIIVALMLVASFAGCSGNSSDNASNNGDSEISSSTTDNKASTNTNSDMFTSRDSDSSYDEASATKINLDEGSVTIDKEGTYVLSGKLENGGVTVDANDSDKIQLVLDGVNITNDSSSAIYVKNADKVFITLSSGSENSLSVTGEYSSDDENNVDAVIFSKADLSLNGEGSLVIDAQYGNGITSKDDLVVSSGEYTISAKGHGIEGKDSVRIADGVFNIDSEKDSIHSENSDDTSLGFVYIENGEFNISALGDGISASGNLDIIDGSFDITTGGGSENGEEHTDDKMMHGGNGGGRPNGTPPEFDAENPPEMPSDFNAEPPTGERPQMPFDSSTQTDENEASTDESLSSAANPSETQSTASTEEESVSSKGIKSSGEINIANGDFNINSADDSIHSNSNINISGGNFAIKSGDDAIHSETNLVIDDGDINISESYEGIEGMVVEINGGNIELVASDDGINATDGSSEAQFMPPSSQTDTTKADDCYIKITGGKITIDASGDGVDSNGNIYVSGGETFVFGPTNSGNASLDYDGTAEINGGVFVAVGSSGMAQNFGDTSTQGAMLVNAQTEKQPTDEITLKDSDGNSLISVTPKKTYSSVLISTPAIKSSQSYSVSFGDETADIEMTELIYGASRGGFRGPRG